MSTDKVDVTSTCCFIANCVVLGDAGVKEITLGRSDPIKLALSPNPSQGSDWRVLLL